MLTVDQLIAIRGSRPILRGLSFSVAAGQGLVIQGENGAGKSTLLRILAGLRAPDAGTVRWNGDDVAEDHSAYVQNIAYLGHLDAIKPALTIEENLSLAVHPVDTTRFEAVLSEAGLDHLGHLPAYCLSAGQKRRLALCRVFLSPGQLWLLDEPSVGLDDKAVRWIEAAFARHGASGGIVVASTHLPLSLPDATVLRL